MLKINYTKLKKDGYDFNLIAQNYKKLASDRVKISGGDSSYFAEYKVIEVKRNIPDSSTTQKSILDVGCGVGLSSPYFAKYFPESQIIGIDISEESINIAKEQNYFENVKYMVYDGSHFPLKDESISIAFCSGVFHHVVRDEIRASIISEIYRTLKTDGYMFIFEHNPNNIFTRIITNNPEDRAGRLVPIKDMRKLVNLSLFRDIKVANTLFFPRYKLFYWALPLETYLRRVPLGGQYYLIGKK